MQIKAAIIIAVVTIVALANRTSDFIIDQGKKGCL